MPCIAAVVSADGPVSAWGKNNHRRPTTATPAFEQVLSFIRYRLWLVSTTVRLIGIHEGTIKYSKLGPSKQ